MSLVSKLKQTAGKLGLVGLMALGSVGCSEGVSMYRQQDGYFNRAEKVVLLEDFEENNPVLPGSREEQDSIAFLNDVNEFQIQKAAQKGYSRKVLGVLSLKVSENSDYVEKKCGLENVAACYSDFDFNIFIETMPFVSFNDIMFHELGHFQHLTGEFKTAEAVAEYNRIYSDITVYQMDKKLGSFLVDHILSGSAYPSLNVYERYSDPEDMYEAAYVTAIFALNYFDGDIEKTEKFFLDAGKDGIRQIFSETMHRYEGQPLRTAYIYEFEHLLASPGFKRSLMGSGYLTENEAEEYIRFVKFKLYDLVSYVMNFESGTTPEIKEKMMESAEDFFELEKITNERFRNIVGTYLVPRFKSEVLDPLFLVEQKDIRSVKEKMDDFMYYAETLPCDKNDKFACPGYLRDVSANIVFGLNIGGFIMRDAKEFNTAIEYADYYLNKFYTGGDYTYVPGKVSDTYLVSMLYLAMDSELKKALAAEGSERNEYMCEAEDYLDALKESSCEVAARPSLMSDCLKDRGDHSILIKNYSHRIKCEK